MPPPRHLVARRVVWPWLVATLVLGALAWLSRSQPFYRPVLVGVGVAVAFVAGWWSWRVHARRHADRRTGRSRRRRRRRR